MLLWLMNIDFAGGDAGGAPAVSDEGRWHFLTFIHRGTR